MLRSFFRSLLLCMLLLKSPFLQAATPTISDSIDIKNITIRLNITDYAGKTITGNSTLHIKSLVDHITTLPLDLLALTVDSVKNDAGALSYTQAGELLSVHFISELNTGDSTDVTVYYHGAPEQDATWGGWYWSGDYSYQLGVGFDAVPHNYGRIWFPCFDNFIERNTYRYEIITTSDKKAFCGGLLESETNNGDGTTTWIWNCQQEIPSYLASVAVCTYSTINMMYPGMERDIPIQIATKPEDTTDAINSFAHLNDALSIFEHHYGPYQWDRVGYAIVPFSGGAMEHAMNIAYPLFAITGTTTWEILFVHELSHHWWGDLITTSKAEEMWMNEGWASYSEHLFTEFEYGRQAYKDAIAANHTEVLHYAAADDGNNYFAISNVPLDYTYGTTTYKKGADVIHTMRGYMGDSLFFSGITAFLQTHKFQPVTAADLRDFLTDTTGVDMTNFFDDWVYQPGAPAFEINAIGSNKGALNSICIQQKLDHATHFCNGVPLTIKAFDHYMQLVDSFNVVMSGERMMFSGLPEINADYYFIIDYDQRINDAVTEDELHVNGAGHYMMDNALVDLDITSMSDSIAVYAQHYWVPADNFKTPHPGLHVSTDRYWRILVDQTTTFESLTKLLYNGQATTGGGFLDNDFITNSEDSLVLLFRYSNDFDWFVYPYYTLNTWGSTNDKRGAFELSQLMSGEYTIGIYDKSIPDAPLDSNSEFDCPDYTSIQNINASSIRIYPNPSSNYLSVDIAKPEAGLQLRIINITGDTVGTFPLQFETQTIPVKNLPAGTYQLYVENARFERIAAQKLVIMH